MTDTVTLPDTTTPVSGAIGWSRKLVDIGAIRAWTDGVDYYLDFTSVNRRLTSLLFKLTRASLMQLCRNILEAEGYEVREALRAECRGS